MLSLQCLLDGQKTGTVLSACPLHTNESYFGQSSTQGNLAASTNSLGSMVGGVVGGEAGWKLFNEGMLSEEGVVIFGTLQYALVVGSQKMPNIFIQSTYCITPKVASLSLQVRLSPHLQVYERLSRPDGTREGSLPYTAWKSSPYTGDMPSGEG